jgi:hypothetical protein
MARFSKIVLGKFLPGILGACCLQSATSNQALAQFATNLDIDRATVQSVVNTRRIMPAPSDLDQYQDPGAAPISPTRVSSAPVSPTAIDSALKPAIILPVATTSGAGEKAGTPTGNFTVPATPTSYDGRQIAQAQPSVNNDFVPLDLTPVHLPERATTFNGFDAFKTQSMYRLPARLFFDMSVENSLRFELNTFQTNRHYLSDMIYRVLPNITVGYALTKKTRVSANYFFLRDQYDKRNKQLSRNFQSVGARIDHDIKLSDRSTLTLGFMPRVLFINASHAPAVVYNDLLPSATITRTVRSGVVYGSFIGQLRFRDILSKFQEGDQFYSLGGVWRKGAYNLLADSTLITNFGNSNLRQGPNNQNIIMTFEAGRRIHPRLPITAFVRAQPIFNIGANHSPGYSGFNFRIFGGIRAELAKPAIFPIKLKQS